MKIEKAPSPDGFSSEVYKLVFHHQLDILLGALNAYLEKCIFPCRWKEERFAFANKGEGDPVLWKLNSDGKVFRKLIRTR